MADLLPPSPAQLPGEYTPDHTLQGATGSLGTIAISVYSQVLIYSWVNQGNIVATRSPHGTVFDEPTGLAGLESCAPKTDVSRLPDSNDVTGAVLVHKALLHVDQWSSGITDRLS